MTPELAKDVRIAGDVVIASLAVSALRLIARKGFIEPAAAWIGQESLRRLGRAVLGRVSKSQSNQDASR